MKDSQELILNRFSYTNTHTFGILYDENSGIPLCVTMELPYLDNEINISCIPEGEYVCRNYSSKKYKNSYELLDVKERTNILMHCGAYVEHTQGCILIGTSFGIIEDRPAILHTRTAMKILKDKYVEGFNLKIAGHKQGGTECVSF